MRKLVVVGTFFLVITLLAIGCSAPSPSPTPSQTQAAPKPTTTVAPAAPSSTAVASPTTKPAPVSPSTTAPAATAKQVTWRVGAPGVRRESTEAIHGLDALLQQHPEVGIKLNIVYGGTLGSAQETLSLVGKNAFEAGFLTVSLFTGQFP